MVLTGMSASCAGATILTNSFLAPKAIPLAGIVEQCTGSILETCLCGGILRGFVETRVSEHGPQELRAAVSSSYEARNEDEGECVRTKEEQHSSRVVSTATWPSAPRHRITPGKIPCPRSVSTTTAIAKCLLYFMLYNIANSMPLAKKNIEAAPRPGRIGLFDA